MINAIFFALVGGGLVLLWASGRLRSPASTIGWATTPTIPAAAPFAPGAAAAGAPAIPPPWWSWAVWNTRFVSWWEKFNNFLIGIAILGFVYLIFAWFLPDLFEKIPAKLWVVAALGIGLITLAWNFFEENKKLRTASIWIISALLAIATAAVLWEGYKDPFLVWRNTPSTAWPTTPTLTTPPAQTRQASAPAAATDPRCAASGNVRLVPWEYAYLSPSGRCLVTVIGARSNDWCVYYRRATWTKDHKEYGPFCDGPRRHLNGPLPDDVSWVRSAETPFEAFYELKASSGSSSPAYTNRVGLDGNIGLNGGIGINWR